MTEESQDRAQKEYYRARAENIKKQVTVYDILNYYNVRIRTENAEVQFPCPLHGDGKDAGYSARAYPPEDGEDYGGTYCWGCHKARDVIEWVKDKESLSFVQAMKLIEEKFSVDNVPNIYKFFDPAADRQPEEGDESTSFVNNSRLVQEINSILSSSKQGTQIFSFIEKKIFRLSQEKKDDLNMSDLLRLYYVLDSVQFDLKQNNIDEEKAQTILAKLISKIQILKDK